MSYLYRMDVPQNLGPTEKNSQMALAVWKIENNYYTKNISTMHSLTGVPRVLRNQKLSIEYNLYSFKVNFQLQWIKLQKTTRKLCFLCHFQVFCI